MTWRWFLEAKSSWKGQKNILDRSFESEGIRFSVRTGTDASPSSLEPTTFGAEHEVVSLLQQLEESGIASPRDNSLILPWAAIYELQRSAAFPGSADLLSIPGEQSVRLALSSRGSLTDPDFAVTVESWLDEHGRHLPGPLQVAGAIAHSDGRPFLLPEAVWRTLAAINAFRSQLPETRTHDGNRTAWATIRRHAVEAKSQLGDFLQHTIVVKPERLRIGLRKVEFGDDKVIEVAPSFDGAPGKWMEFFDRFPVSNRYDVPTGEGIVQVVVEPNVRQVLEEIKRIPGRRVAGARAEAFIANPFAALGGNANSVIDEAEFEEERIAAGLTYQRFTTRIDRDGLGYPTTIVLQIAEAIGDAIRSEDFPLENVATLQQFVGRLRAALDGGRQLLAWRGFDLELLGDSRDQLNVLADALTAWQKPHVAVQYAEVFDLSRYSARIETIGVDKPYCSAFIARKQDEDGWLPDNVVMGVCFTADGTDEPSAFPLTKGQIDALKVQVEAASSSGAETVSIPGCPRPIPLKEAKQLVGDLDAASLDVSTGTFDPTKQESSSAQRKDRKTLVIKANVQAVDYTEARRAALISDVHRLPSLPSNLRPNVALKEHQEKGVSWLEHLWSQAPDNCRGAILADDMGLGKTLQLLAFIARRFEDDPNLAPVLVVAPVSLLENWKDEIDKFFVPGSLAPLMLYGESLQSLKVPRDQLEPALASEGIVRFLRSNWARGAKLVLTTYETLRDYEFSLAAQEWSIMVCDEAQRIKNPNAMVTRAAKKQKVHFKVVCTGTPIENTLADLWCLFDFIQPGLLGSLNDFGTRYRRPIEAETDEEKSRVEELRTLIDPQVLRRLKREVAKDLPNKYDRPTRLAISDRQRDLYRHAVTQFRKRDGADRAFQHHFGLLQYLRRVCTDPRPIGQLSGLNEPFDLYSSQAPKIRWLIETLQEIRRKNEKVIIFVELRDVQRLLQFHIRERIGYACEIINGDTTASASAAASRQKRIKRFQEAPGFGAIILSPLAVGFGVNIQGANHVVHYMRAWNPAKEDQATDRAYRIGQTKDVHVYRPIVCADEFKTFDQKLDELLSWKRELSQDMLNGSFDLTAKDFSDLGAPDGATLDEGWTLSISDVMALDPDAFECFCAALWEKLKFSVVYRTPKSRDGGIDVVAIRGREGVLIQCKSSRVDGQELGWNAIKDVVAGTAGYEQRHRGVGFRMYAVTNQFFNETARRQASLNGVELIDQMALDELLKKNPISNLDLEQYLIPN